MCQYANVPIGCAMANMPHGNWHIGTLAYWHIINWHIIKTNSKFHLHDLRSRQQESPENPPDGK